MISMIFRRDFIRELLKSIEIILMIDIKVVLMRSINIMKNRMIKQIRKISSPNMIRVYIIIINQHFSQLKK
jgi:hypothetical protein